MVEMAMTEAQFAAMQTRLRANGIELQGKSGELSKDGVTARYRHADGRLQVDIMDRPFLLPLSLIEGRLRAYFEQSIAAGDGHQASAS